jgi:hypothetical protein
MNSSHRQRKMKKSSSETELYDTCLYQTLDYTTEAVWCYHYSTGWSISISPGILDVFFKNICTMCVFPNGESFYMLKISPNFQLIQLDDLN